jgi:hypothetical protein
MSSKVGFSMSGNVKKFLGALPFFVLLVDCSRSPTRPGSPLNLQSNIEPYTEGADSDKMVGVPDFCSESKNDIGQFCLTCAPKKFPLLKCGDVKPDFDSHKACYVALKSKELICDTQQPTPFVIGLDTIPVDELYFNLKNIKANASELLRAQAGKEEDREAALEILLFPFQKYNSGCFMNCDPNEATEEFFNMINARYPITDMESAKKIKTGFLDTFVSFSDRVRKGDYDSVEVQQVPNYPANCPPYVARFGDKFQVIEYLITKMRLTMPADSNILVRLGKDDTRVPSKDCSPSAAWQIQDFFIHQILK